MLTLVRTGFGALVLGGQRRGTGEAGSGFNSQINGMESGPSKRALLSKRRAKHTQHFYLSDAEMHDFDDSVLARIWERVFSNAVVGLRIGAPDESCLATRYMRMKVTSCPSARKSESGHSLLLPSRSQEGTCHSVGGRAAPPPPAEGVLPGPHARRSRGLVVAAAWVLC